METEFSASNIGRDLKVDTERWDRLVSDRELEWAKAAMEKRGFQVMVLNTGNEALDAIKTLIPPGAQVMNGSSTTLAEIGFVEYLKQGKHGWKNLHETILAEKDRAKQGDLRRQAGTAEFFLSSANAIARTGEIVACDASGSRTGAFLFTAKHLVLVVGANKIAATLEEAMERVRRYAFILENARAQRVYGMGSATNKWAILEGDYPGRTRVILVKEKLGY